MQFNSAGSGSRIQGHCRYDVDGESNSDAHGDGGGHNGGDGQRNDDGDGGDWVSCLEQRGTIPRPNLGHIGWWRVYHTCIQMRSQTSNTRLAVGIGRTWAETVSREMVVVSRGSTGLGFWRWQGWALEQLWLLAGTVGSAVGQPLAKERPLGYHRQ